MSGWILLVLIGMWISIMFVLLIKSTGQNLMLDALKAINAQLADILTELKRVRAASPSSQND